MSDYFVKCHHPLNDIQATKYATLIIELQYNELQRKGDNIMTAGQASITIQSTLHVSVSF